MVTGDPPVRGVVGTAPTPTGRSKRGVVGTAPASPGHCSHFHWALLLLLPDKMGAGVTARQLPSWGLLGLGLLCTEGCPQVGSQGPPREEEGP